MSNKFKFPESQRTFITSMEALGFTEAQVKEAAQALVTANRLVNIDMKWSTSECDRVKAKVIEMFSVEQPETSAPTSASIAPSQPPANLPVLGTVSREISAQVLSLQGEQLTQAAERIASGMAAMEAQFVEQAANFVGGSSARIAGMLSDVYTVEAEEVSEVPLSFFPTGSTIGSLPPA